MAIDIAVVTGDLVTAIPIATTQLDMLVTRLILISMYKWQVILLVAF